MKHRRLLGLGLLCLGAAAVAAAAPRLLSDLETTLVYPAYWHTPFGIHRGTQELLARFTQRRARFDGPEGLACTRLLSAPAAESPDDCRVTVIGANSRQANLIYNPTMTQLDVLGGPAAGAGLFRRPVGVALAPDGTAYVTDPGLKRVFRLRLQDGTLRPRDELPPPPGGWIEPWGICLDSRQRVYVSDAGRSQIVVYSPGGALEKVFGPALGGGGDLQEPRALAVTDAAEPWSYYRDDYLYVCDRGGRRLQRLGWRNSEPQVQLQRSAADLPGSDTPAAFAWLALDYYENLWVTDPARCQVHKFDRHLQPLASCGGPGAGDGRFQHPTGVAIFRNFGQVFVAEAEAAHYFWIGTDLLSTRAQWQADPALLALRFTLTEPSQLLVTAQAANGRSLEILRRVWVDSGPQLFYWRCPETLRGQPLTLTLLAEATYSSRSHFAKEVTLAVPTPERAEHGSAPTKSNAIPSSTRLPLN